MLCPHLRTLEEELIRRGFRETFRGQAWERNCREWVYFDCVIDPDATRARFALAASVEFRQHLGTHDGQEAGFVCTACCDGVLGHHPSYLLALTADGGPEPASARPT